MSMRRTLPVYHHIDLKKPMSIAKLIRQEERAQVVKEGELMKFTCGISKAHG